MSRRILEVRRIFLRKTRLHSSDCRSSSAKVTLRLINALTTLRLAVGFFAGWCCRCFPVFLQHKYSREPRRAMRVRGFIFCRQLLSGGCFSATFFTVEASRGAAPAKGCAGHFTKIKAGVALFHGVAPASCFLRRSALR